MLYLGRDVHVDQCTSGNASPYFQQLDVAIWAEYNFQQQKLSVAFLTEPCLYRKGVQACLKCCFLKRLILMSLKYTHGLIAIYLFL